MEDSTKPAEMSYEFLPFLRAYTDGRVERLLDADIVPPSTDSSAGVASRDVPVLPEVGVSARIFLPEPVADNPARKLPLVVYFHGGAFCSASPFCARYHDHLAALAAALAVDYRKARSTRSPPCTRTRGPRSTSLSHRDGDGPEARLNEIANFGRVFLARANIAHNLGLVAGDPDYGLGLEILGLALVHPFFLGAGLDPGSDRVWAFACPGGDGSEDPRVNPVAEGGPGLAMLGCRRVLVCVAEKDVLKDTGRVYCEELVGAGGRALSSLWKPKEKVVGFIWTIRKERKIRIW